MKIRINGKDYDVIVLKTNEEKMKGLQDVEEMEDNEGALFIYDEPQELNY